MEPLKLIKITDDLAQKIINNSNLDKREMCSTLQSVRVGGKRCDGVYTVTENAMGEPSVYGKVYQACCNEDCSYIAKWQKDIGMAIKEAGIQCLVSQEGLAPKIRELLICDKGIIIIMDALSITAMRLLTSLSNTQYSQTLEYYTEVLNKILDDIEKKGENVSDLREKLNEPMLTFEELHNMKGKINRKSWKVYGRTSIDEINVIGEDTLEQKKMRKDIMNQIIELIFKIHQMDVAHLDTHLNNFMKGSNESKLYLIDFGLSKNNPNMEDRKYDYLRALRDIKKFYEEDGYINLGYLVDYSKDLYERSIEEERKIYNLK